MNKYQEALDRLRRLSHVDIEKIEGYQMIRREGFYDDLRLIQGLVDKHKPPTLEEVVEAWEELGYKFKIGDEYYDIEVTRRESRMELLIIITYSTYYKFGIDHSRADKNWSFSYVSFDEHRAINLTIRYLEAQKKE